MKKFLVVLSALVCILGLSVSSIALVSKVPSDFGSVFVEKDDRYSLAFEIKASQFNTDVAAFWSQWTAAFTGDDPTKIALSYISSSCNDVKFLLLDSNYTFFYASNSGVWFMRPPSTSSFFPYITVSCSTGLASGISKITYSNSFSVSGTDFCFSGYSKLSNLPEDFKYVDFDGKSVEITDDLGSFDVEPEEPNPPSSSSPSWIPPVVSDPVIPEGDEYVFYDTKILGLFLKHIRSQIVHAANVGWLIFGFILVWHVIKRVIKAFSSR